MINAKCQVLISPIRKDLTEQSEMLSQLLYGETCDVIQNSGDYSRIRMHLDETEGWTLTHNLSEVAELNPKNIVQKPFGVFNLPEGRSLLSMGSEVDFEVEKKVDLQDLRKSISKNALEFLNVPFLWGGRSFFGVDAAGFVQLVFKIHGVKLPRTADLMAQLGEVLDFLGESQAGDLAFFENDEGTIVHVGIMLNSYEIIHAFGKVRIDSVDSCGIYSSELKKHTHRLRFIKKVIL